MLRPQTVPPHETEMHSSVECKAQAPSPTPPGLAQFDRDLAARREEGLRGEPASSPCRPSTPTLLPSTLTLCPPSSPSPLPSASTLGSPCVHRRPPPTHSVRHANMGPARTLHMHGMYVTYVAHALHTHHTYTHALCTRTASTGPRSPTWHPTRTGRRFQVSDGARPCTSPW